MTIDNFKSVATKRRILANDKVTKAVFDMNKDEQNIFESDRKIRLYIDEKIKDSTTEVFIKLLDEYTGRAKLTQFDKAVFFACISVQAIGNTTISLNQIYRYLGGGSSEPTENEYNQILDSLTRLMACIIDVDCSELARKSRYKFGKITQFRGAILPGKYEKADINGKQVRVFKFYAQAPLFEIAKIKGQVIYAPLAIYRIKGLRNTPRVIAIKELVVQRVIEYKHAKEYLKRYPFGDRRLKLPDSILLGEIYHAAELDIPTIKQAQNVREIVKKVLDKLVENHVLESYQFILRGKTYHSVKFVVVEGDIDVDSTIGDIISISG